MKNLKQSLEILEQTKRVNDNMIAEAFEKQAFGEAFDNAIDALQKQIPMKIKEIHVDEYFCPACGSENNCSDGVVGDNYCPQCGQRLQS